MTDLRALVGVNVKRLRQDRGMTQASLADAIQRSVDMVSRLERGDAAPSFETIAALADALGAHPAELFGGRPLNDAPWQSSVQALIGRLAAGGEEEAVWVTKLLDHLDRRPRG